MSVTSTTTPDNNEMTIDIKGRFDFSSHQEFRRAYEGLEVKPTSFKVNMKETSYLDSSALGMLLLLRDYGGGDKSSISILNCNEEVKKILTISNFEKLFNIQ